MTHGDFNHLLSSLPALSPQQMRRVLRELETRLAATAGKRPAPAEPDAEETAYDLATRAGLIGCIPSAPRSPTDLSTNKKHMEGFGRD